MIRYYLCAVFLCLLQTQVFYGKQKLLFVGPFAIYGFAHRILFGLKSLLQKDPLLFLVLALALLGDTRGIKDMPAFPQSLWSRL